MYHSLYFQVNQTISNEFEDQLNQVKKELQLAQDEIKNLNQENEKLKKEQVRSHISNQDLISYQNCTLLLTKCNEPSIAWLNKGRWIRQKKNKQW